MLVLVTPGEPPLFGDLLLEHLHDLFVTKYCNSRAVCVFPTAVRRWEVAEFQRWLKEVSMNLVTAGLAFHPHQSPHTSRGTGTTSSDKLRDASMRRTRRSVHI